MCATIKPRGSGLDDTANIQNAVTACPAGQVVSLAAGTLTVGEGNSILLNKGITCAGLVPARAIRPARSSSGPTAEPLSPRSNGNCGSNPSPFIIVGPDTA